MLKSRLPLTSGLLHLACGGLLGFAIGPGLVCAQSIPINERNVTVQALGNSDENLRLSQARANTVRSYLIEVGGIAPKRLSSVGKGDLEPLNLTSDSAPENRRVTFITAAQ
jgi:OmpA family